MEQTGFAPYRQAGVGANLGQTIHLDIVLAPALESEKVTVSAQPSIIDTSQTSIVSGLLKSSDALRSLTFTIYRRFEYSAAKVKRLPDSGSLSERQLIIGNRSRYDPPAPQHLAYSRL